MGLAEAATLLSLMVLLAALPGLSVLAVTTRAASRGFADGAATAAGIVAGDMVFVFLALFGLTTLAQALGDLFVLIKWLGGCYLIWFGIGLLRAPAGNDSAPSSVAASRTSGFLTGLFITLGDMKAIVFYMSLFPALVDVPALTGMDIALVLAITLVGVGGVKLVYAQLAARAGAMAVPVGLRQTGRGVAGALVIAAGVYVIFRG